MWDKLKRSRLGHLPLLILWGLFYLPEHAFDALRSATGPADVLRALGPAYVILTLSAILWILAPLAGVRVAKASTAIVSAFWCVGVGVALWRAIQQGAIDPAAVGRWTVENDLNLAILSIAGLVMWGIESRTSGVVRFWARTAFALVAVLSILLSPMLSGPLDLGWMAFCVGMTAIFASVAFAYYRIDKAAHIPPQSPAP